jgi:N-formylglutamate amidohydrolase
MIDVITGNIISVDNMDCVDSKTFDNSCIISIPHGGRWIPQACHGHYRTGRELLVDLDLYTDELFSLGFGTIITMHIAPVVVNPSRNRHPIHDPSLPRHLQRDPLHAGSLLGGEVLLKEHTAEQEKRLLAYYDQYHATLQKAIDAMKKAKGYAIVFDSHSMFSKGLKNTPDEGKRRASFVVGTLGHTSADTSIINALLSGLQSPGYDVAIDNPYKGGYITQKYADPANNIHVIQLEVSRDRYMVEGFENPISGEFEKNDQFETTKKIISRAYQQAASAIVDRTY